MLDKETKEAILEAQTKATLGGHDLGSFEILPPPAGGYEAVCRLCDNAIWVAGGEILFDGLNETCPKEPPKYGGTVKIREIADPDDLERLFQDVKAFDKEHDTILYELLTGQSIDDEEE